MKFKVQVCQRTTKNGYYIAHADSQEQAEDYVDALVNDNEIDHNHIKWDSKTIKEELIAGEATYVGE